MLPAQSRNSSRVRSSSDYNESPLTQAMVADVSPPDEREGAFSVYFVDYVAGALWAGGMGLIVPRFGFTAVFALMVASYVVSAFVLLSVAPGWPAGGFAGQCLNQKAPSRAGPHLQGLHPWSGFVAGGQVGLRG